MDDLKLNLEPIKSKCKGLLFRGRVSSYLNSEKKIITTKKEIILLKRKSCPGCDECGWIFDFLQEELYNSENDYLKNIKNGKFYRITFRTSNDYETGIQEIDDWEFVEVKK